jgi:serine/threonine protein kinase
MGEIVPPPPNASHQDAVGIDPLSDADGLPRRFGKYTLLRKLATGGMAELFLAIQRSVAGFEKLIVIKRILPSMTRDRAFIDMLLHEARVAATLSHPNVVQIFDVGQVDGAYYIAMEHVHGEDLRSIVRQMRKKGVSEFPLEHAVSIMLGVCAGLAYAHDKRDLDGSPLRIVHRDISPQNVVVTFTGDVKIVDFGIAKSDSKVTMTTETRSGKLKGKVPYMSPEQARGEEIDARSDIFAVGVMLFELTTGKRLFKGQSEFETLKLICERQYPTPSQVRPGYPVELEYIVMRALAKDRAARFQSAREMQAALEEYVRRDRIPTSTIALTHFMQSLFEDKLAAQKEALLQGKQLADIIELQSNLERQSEPDTSGRLSTSVLSAPAASRTVTDLSASRPGSRRGAVVFLLSAAALLGCSVGAYYVVSQRARVVGASVPAPEPSVASQNRGSLALSSDPAGASIWIDGELRSEVTPATIAQLPVGRAIDVRLTKDGFEETKQAVTLTPGEANGKIDVALTKGSVVVDVSVSPASAVYALNLDGKPSKGTTIEGISSGDQHKLVVSAPGFADQSFTFIGASQEKKHFDVTLQKEAHRGRAAFGAAPPVGTGRINVGASGGWCNVTIDGVARGATPVAGIELSAGAHKVTCTPPDHSPMATTVIVPADGTARYRFSLGQ